jgi:putative transposase
MRRASAADGWSGVGSSPRNHGQLQDIGWAEHWTCTRCRTRHQRDDNAAVNLARYEPPLAGDSAVGPVGAAVKRRADRKTGPRPAGGDEARKGGSHEAAEQPRDGVPA